MLMLRYCKKEGDRSATVLFKIAENEKRKISKIIFVGNENISSKKIVKRNGNRSMEVLEVLVQAIKISTIHIRGRFK